MRQMRAAYLLLLTMAVAVGPSPAEGADDTEALRSLLESQQKRIALLEKEIETLKANPLLALSPYVKLVEKEEIRGVKGPHIMFEGANVHIRSGSGYSNDRPPNTKIDALHGLGNLIIGYNEEPYDNFTLLAGDRGGSHNLVLGVGNRFMNFGGIVHGWENTVKGVISAVISGDSNSALGNHSVVLGGWNNEAKGTSSTACGGKFNTAAGKESLAAGGSNNLAEGRISVVSGGDKNKAAGRGSTVIGGSGNAVDGAWTVAVGKGANPEEDQKAIPAPKP